MRKTMRFLIAGALAVMTLPAFAQGGQTEVERRLQDAWSPEQWSDAMMLQDIRHGLSGGDRWHFDRMMWQLPGNDVETILLLMRTSYRGGMAYAWESGRGHMYGYPVHRERMTIRDTTVRDTRVGDTRVGTDVTVRTETTVRDQQIRDEWRDAWDRERLMAGNWDTHRSWDVTFERLTKAEQARVASLWDRLTWAERDALKHAVHNAIRWGGTAHTWRTTRMGTMRIR
jgi:hypothetical protein